MISEQGAILIATVYPIGLLLLLVEGVGAFGAFVDMFGRRLRWLGFGLVLTVTSTTLIAVALCVVSVSSGVTLRGVAAWTVGLAGLALGLFFSFAVGILLAKGIGTGFSRSTDLDR